MRSRYAAVCCLLLATAFAWAAPANAQALDTPSVGVVDAGHGKVHLTVTAGASGAPNGFQVRWMSAAQFAALGGSWSDPSTSSWISYTGIGTLNTWGAAQVNFKLAPNEALGIEVGDTSDETGVSGVTNQEMAAGTDFVFVVTALGDTPDASSSPSLTVTQATTSQGVNCTYTIGYWKNHTNVWPVSSLVLGGITYNQTQLLSILNEPVGGNGLISLAHQLIGAMLNIANGATPTPDVTAANTLISGLLIPPVGSDWLDPSVTSTLTQSLDDYNNGVTGPGHCGTVPARHATWGMLKSSYR